MKQADYNRTGRFYMFANLTKTASSFFALISGLIFSLFLVDIVSAQTDVSSAQTNTSLGVGALRSNTMGTVNTANGAFALGSNTTGSFNTAIGSDALRDDTTGSFNTASG